MPITDEPINNLEQARRYFVAMGCSHFHLDREHFDRSDEYHALRIDPALESNWRKQEFDQRLINFNKLPAKEVGIEYFRLKDIIEENEYYVDNMLKLAKSLCDTVESNQIQMLCSSIIGNSSTRTHGGLIECSIKIGRTDIAQAFAECCQILLNRAHADQIHLPWIRGYFADVISKFKLKVKKEYLRSLRLMDDLQNFEHYLNGANEGNVFSMRLLAKHYISGKGCNVDIEKATYWLSKAADTGNGLAQQELKNLVNPTLFNQLKKVFKIFS